MTNEIEQVPVNYLPNGNIGTGVQDVAMIGAMLTGVGLTRLQVQGLIAQIQKVSMQVALTSITEILGEIQKVREAQLMDIINRLSTMPAVMGQVSKNHVVQIVSNVLSSTPRQ